MADSRYFGERDIYEAYDNKHNISWETFTLITRTFFLHLIEAVIDEGKVFSFPNKLGIFGVFKTKTKAKMIDYNHYKKTGEKVMMRNFHSHGYMAKIS